MKWLPLESNPTALNAYAQRLGLSSDKARFVDVFGVDDELLMMVPQPVYAVMLLFPLNDAHEVHSATEAASIKEQGQSLSDNLFFMKQTIGNACGTIGVLHAIGSHADKLAVAEDSVLAAYLDKARAASPDERARLLEEDGGIASAHLEAVQAGQTAVPDIEDQVKLHFICFTVVDGTLYELDGRKPYPVAHGSASEAECLHKAMGVVRQFMARAPESLHFNMMALTGGEPLF